MILKYACNESASIRAERTTSKIKYDISSRRSYQTQRAVRGELDACKGSGWKIEKEKEAVGPTEALHCWHEKRNNKKKKKKERR